jgi:hypothetical protein
VRRPCVSFHDAHAELLPLASDVDGPVRSILPLFEIAALLVSLAMWRGWNVAQDNSLREHIAASSSTNAVNFSSARTTKRFPSVWEFSAAKLRKLRHALQPTALLATLRRLLPG